MRKTIIFLMLVIISITANAQEKATAINISGGYAGGGLAFNVGVGFFNPDKNAIAVDLFYNAYDLKQDDYTIPYSLMGMDLTYNLNLIKNPKSTFGLSIGLGGSLALESLNNGNKELPTGAELEYYKGLIYGPASNITFSLVLSNRMDLIVKNSLDYHLNSDVGSFFNYTTIGVRIIF